jgi:hypothetical protein
MMKEAEDFNFDFGPISRTLREGGNYLGFASLPVHEAVTALLGARNRDEFIAWLWHDTFKALFEWVSRRDGSPSWHHLPNNHIARFASATHVPSDLVQRHHVRQRQRRDDDLLSESDTITNEFSALYLGRKARFVQLSFACQATAHTIPLRQCIIEAFLRAVSQVVAKGVTGFNLPFSRVLYSFQAQPDEQLTPEQVAAQYQLQVVDETLSIVHCVPSDKFKTAQLSLDLTDSPPRRETLDALALIELLTVYRDELTTVAAVPLFLDSLDTVVEEIRAEMGVLLPDILEQAGIQATHKRAATDSLLDVVLEQMVEVRSVSDDCNEEYEVMWKGKPKKRQGKPIHKLIQRPYQLMADNARKYTCVVCGTPIGQEAADCYRGSPRLQTVFSGNFTDFEHVDFEGVVCPLCLIYANSKNRGLLRGALAFLSPSTALNAPVGSQLLETPRFDDADRFDPAQPLPKTAVTLQEMVLLTAISRRIVDRIVDGLLPFAVKDRGNMVSEVQMVKPDKKTTVTPVGVYLPYAGVYLIHHQTAVHSLYRDVLVGSETEALNLWQTVQLRAYPFQLEIAPAFTLLVSMRDSSSYLQFRARHTLLKSHPTQVFLSPTASFNVLVDDAVQETVDSELAEAIRLVRQLADVCDLRYKERRAFVKALLAGHDPMEAVYVAVSVKKEESFRLAQAQRLWNREEVTTGETAEEQWLKFTQLAERVRDLAQAHPTLLSLI